MSDQVGEIKENEDNTEVVTVKMDFPKRPVEDILEDAKSISPEDIANELITWLITNVENYVDNHAKLFKIPLDNLDVQAGDDSSSSMIKTSELQNLYRAIPDDTEVVVSEIETIEQELTPEEEAKIEELVKCRDSLDGITAEAFEIIQTKEKELEELYERLIYYYELKGFKEGVPIIQEFDGLVKILKFDYEPFSVGVKIMQKENPLDETSEKKVVKEYIIPEGFVVWVELACKTKQRPTSMF